MRFGEDLLRRLHLRIGRQLPGAQGFQALLVGEGLQAGEPVVSLGNYELQDGMALRVAGKS